MMVSINKILIAIVFASSPADLIADTAAEDLVKSTHHATDEKADRQRRVSKRFMITMLYARF